MNIALSFSEGSESYTNYSTWLNKTHPDINIIHLDKYAIDDIEHILKTCSGIVFTGGGDINPSFYGQSDRLKDCTVDDIRDAREKKMFEICTSFHIPILAICRGEQIINVFSGGTLIVDIPSDTQSDIEHRSIQGIDSFHEILIEPGSLLRKIVKTDSIQVNSSHHQAVQYLPPMFTASAYSHDDIIEAFEWADPNGNSFLLAVQWHPERLDYSHPCSLSIAKHFLMEAESYSMLFLPLP
jgi:putative glutamine amidotransferase